MRNSYLISGLLILLVAWSPPLLSLTHEHFYGHMIMHMLVVAVAAPLISLGISGSKFDPSEKYPLFFAAIPASVGELLIVWGWHAPAFHHFARHETLGLVFEQASFILAGLWVWISCLNPYRRGAGIIGLLLTSMHMTLLGALLSLAPRSLYHHELMDQQLGGAIMLVVGGIAYLWGGVSLSRHLVKVKHESFS